MGRLATTERLITAPSPHTTLAVQSDHSNNWLLYTQPARLVPRGTARQQHHSLLLVTMAAKQTNNAVTTKLMNICHVYSHLFPVCNTVTSKSLWTE